MSYSLWRIIKTVGTQPMHDIRFIRENPKEFDKALGRRGINAASKEILKIDEDRRSAILAAETAQAEQNKSSKLIGAAKASGNINGESGIFSFISISRAIS